MASAKLPIVLLTDRLAGETAALLGSFAEQRPSEGVVYWFGIETGSWSVVTTLVVPDADTSDGSIRTSVQTNAQTLQVIVDTPLVYLGQAHSHPGSRVGHSPTDDRDTFARFDGAISVVVPWFGRYGMKIEECGIHRHIDGQFRLVKDPPAHLRIIPGFADFRAGEL